MSERDFDGLDWQLQNIHQNISEFLKWTRRSVEEQVRRFAFTQWIQEMHEVEFDNASYVNFIDEAEEIIWRHSDKMRENERS